VVRHAKRAVESVGAGSKEGRRLCFTIEISLIVANMTDGFNTGEQEAVDDRVRNTCTKGGDVRGAKGTSPRRYILLKICF